MNEAKNMASESYGFQSQSRIRQARGPTLLPPPPFQNEADVPGLGWWLEAQMSLAGGQLCVEQMVAAGDRAGRAIASALDEVRDALYELYCDAADPRMAAFTLSSSPLAKHVSEVYSIAEAIVAHLMDDDRRSDLGILWTLGERLAAIPPLEASAWLDRLALDADDPTEPLRTLPRDVLALYSATRNLVHVLREAALSAHRRRAPISGVMPCVEVSERASRATIRPAVRALKVVGQR